MKAWLLLFFVLETSTTALAAREDSLSVKAEVDKAFLTIGERVEYRITVTHDPSIEILSKITPPPSDVFEVKEVHDFSEKQGKQIVEGRRFILTTYELGEFILEPVTLRYRQADGKERSVETHRLYLTVRSVDASGKEKTDIRGPKGVAALPPSWRGMGGVFIFLLVVGGAAYFWWRWKHLSTQPERTQEPPLSPEDEALLRLNRLFDSDLLRRGKLKEYFLELSEILRRYFERRFEILAVESTTSEVLRDLRQKDIPRDLLEKIREVLEEADLVKFAKSKPTATEIIRINQKSKQIVEEARPELPVGSEAVSPPSHHGI